VAHRIGAIDTKDLERVAIDTTVQEKAIAHPTDARLTHRAIEKLVELAKREGVELRQSYLRLVKRAAIMMGRYTHAHQFKRARRELKFLRTPGLAASSVTFAARSRATQRSKTALARCSISRCGFAIKSSVSAGQRSNRCTRPRSSASAEARRARRTSSVARSQLPLRSPRPRAASSCFAPRRCTATHMMATLSAPSSPISKSLQVSRSAASTATRAIAATTIRTGSRSGSAAKSGVSPRPSAARCAGAPPSNRHRPPQGGSPHGPQLSHRPRWRSHQHRARRCRLQLQPARVLSLILCHTLLAAPLQTNPGAAKLSSRLGNPAYLTRSGRPERPEDYFAYRWFCGLSIEDKVPDRSAFSRARCGFRRQPRKQQRPACGSSRRTCA
jgi:hypothetical protein